MRLDDVTVQSKEASRVMPAECVCGSGSHAPARLAQPLVVPTCAECGGSLLRLPVSTSPARPQRRGLQDFLSAFV
ncbi:MAG TPA: hypothetical protein VF815_19805 [Myxococcaceae bacterium]|jgi:hypothetical protein